MSARPRGRAAHALAGWTVLRTYRAWDQQNNRVAATAR